MKRTTNLVAAVLLFLFLSLTPSGRAASDALVRFQARRILRRTQAVTLFAQRQARLGGKYLGLGLAVGHQRYAFFLWNRSRYGPAIYHSLRARVLAVEVIKRNRNSSGTAFQEAIFDAAENRYYRESPSAEALDRALKEAVKALLDDRAAADSAVEAPE